MIRRPPRSTLFPSPTPFRPSNRHVFSASLSVVAAGAPPTLRQIPFMPAARPPATWAMVDQALVDRKSTRLNSSHANISYAVFCLKKKKILYHYKDDTSLTYN